MCDVITSYLISSHECINEISVCNNKSSNYDFEQCVYILQEKHQIYHDLYTKDQYQVIYWLLMNMNVLLGDLLFKIEP